MTTSAVYHITYDTDLNAVIGIWKGYATSSEFRQGAEEMLDVMAANRTQKMLVDLKEMVLIGKDDQDWMDKSFLPKAVSEGLRFVAVVQPTYYFNKVAIESVAYKINKEALRVNFLSTFEEAKAWLKNFEL